MIFGFFEVPQVTYVPEGTNEILSLLLQGTSVTDFKLILVGIFNTMFDLKSVFVFLVLKIHVLLYFSYMVGISVCLKNLDFGPELTFDPGHFCMRL